MMGAVPWCCVLISVLLRAGVLAGIYIRIRILSARTRTCSLICIILTNTLVTLITIMVRGQRGTRAELWLPVANGKAAVAATDSEAGTHQTRRRLRLLFVDDDFLISLSTAALLEDLGHEVVKASSGAAAMEVLESGKPVDLMITDYAMPGMTGVQLAEAARRLRPGLPILLATGYADLPARTKVDLPRLSKPYLQRQLAERITALLG